MSGGRSCGECRACCVELEVVELEKPLGVPCSHLCERGCAIYESPERPSICGSFRCFWLDGFGPDYFRPDRCGVMLSKAATNPATRARFIQANEVVEGAFATTEGRGVLRSAAATGARVVGCPKLPPRSKPRPLAERRFVEVERGVFLPDPRDP